MRAVDALPESDLAALIAAINLQLPPLSMSHEDLELDAVAHKTGISEEHVLALLRGEPVSKDKLNLSLAERLAFLRDTRRGPGGEPFSLPHIAERVGVSRATVWALFAGERKAGADVAAALEEFFRVDPGFLSTNGRRALERALRPVYASLVTLSGLRGEGVSHLAMRGSVEFADIRLAGQLQRALSEVFDHSQNPSEDPPEDPQEEELREIAQQVRALDPTPRGRLMDKIRGLLRQSS